MASFTTKEEAKKYAKKEREDGYLARVVMDWYSWTILVGPRKS